MGKYIDSINLKKLRKEIRELPEDYQSQIKGIEIEEIYKSVEIFKQEFLILNWLHLYVGSRGEKVKKVVGELYRLYPEFQKYIEEQGRDFPGDGKRLRFEDEELFQSWLRDNSSYPGKTWGAIAWMGFRSEEINCFYVWRNHQKYQPGGFEYISFPVWYEGLKCSPRKILVEVNISPEDFRIVNKGLPSVAQLYADHGGKVIISPPETFTNTSNGVTTAVREEYLSKLFEELYTKLKKRNPNIGDHLPIAVSAKDIEYLFGYSVRTIQRWDENGWLTRYKAPHKGGGKKAPVRYVVRDFILFLESQPGSRVGRRESSAGDWVR